MRIKRKEINLHLIQPIFIKVFLTALCVQSSNLKCQHSVRTLRNRECEVNLSLCTL